MEINIDFKNIHMITADTEGDLNSQIAAAKEDALTQEYVTVKIYIGVMIPARIIENS